MREKAKTTQEPTRIITNHVCGTANGLAVSMALPKISNMSRTIRRIRQRHQNAPAMPRSIEELNFEGNYTVTNKKDSFIIHDSGANPDRTVIFGTNANLEFLSACDEWYMDGTFDICPPLFQQVYTIHGK